MQAWEVSTHSRLKAAGGRLKDAAIKKAVSTHSRLKAAGHDDVTGADFVRRFNTQPPEGGWDEAYRQRILLAPVSTHSRLKAAG